MKFQSAAPRTPWFAPPARRIRFLHDLKLNDSNVQVIPAPDPFKGGFAIRTSISPPGVPARKVEVMFSLRSPDIPHVFVNGPEQSPHRYKDGSLCMWFPGDPPEARWRPVNGPSALLGHIAAHLVKEQWHRRTGEWPGDHVGHGDDQ